MRSTVVVSMPCAGVTDWNAVRAGVGLVAGTWVLQVVEELAHGSKRHNELSRALRIDNKRLGRVLRRLQEAQIVARQTDLSQRQVCVRYQLTESGGDLLPLLAALGSWSRDVQV
jgi:DNA-binding HxlR family transcriptional regulator